jgi:hypothetical protein
VDLLIEFGRICAMESAKTKTSVIRENCNENKENKQNLKSDNWQKIRLSEVL